MQESAATILRSYLPKVNTGSSPVQNGLWTPLEGNITLKYAWKVTSQYLARHYNNGQPGTLRSISVFAASTLWHLQLIFHDGTAGCSQNPDAPVQLQLAPTIGSALWHNGDRALVEGRLELPGAPAAATWRSYSFKRVVTKQEPLTLPGLTCKRLMKAMRGGAVVVELYINDMALTWHPESRSVEAQIWRMTQLHYESSMLAHRLGVLPRFQAVTAQFSSHAITGQVGILYRRGLEVSEEPIYVLRRLMYENLRCRMQGSDAAATGKYCEVQHASWRNNQAQQLSAEHLQLMKPCNDTAARPAAPGHEGASPASAHDRDWDPRSAVPFASSPDCDGVTLWDPAKVRPSPDAAAAESEFARFLHSWRSESSAGGAASTGSPQANPHVRSWQPFGASGGGRTGWGSSGLHAVSCVLLLLLGAWSLRYQRTASQSVKGRRRGRQPQAVATSAPSARGQAPQAPPPAVRSSRGAAGGSAAKPQQQPRSRQPKPERGIGEQTTRQRQQASQQPANAARPGRASFRPSAAQTAQSASSALPPQDHTAAPTGHTPRQEQQQQEPGQTAVSPQAIAAPVFTPSRRTLVQPQTAPSSTAAATEAQIPVDEFATAGLGAAPTAVLLQTDSTQPDALLQQAPATASGFVTGQHGDAGSSDDSKEPSQRPEQESAPSSKAPSARASSRGSEPGDGGTCLVCLDAPWQHGFLHGGSVHIGVCGGCVRALTKAAGSGKMSCPVCRGDVERTVALFA